MVFIDKWSVLGVIYFISTRKSYWCVAFIYSVAFIQGVAFNIGLTIRAPLIIYMYNILRSGAWFKTYFQTRKFRPFWKRHKILHSKNNQFRITIFALNVSSEFYLNNNFRKKMFIKFIYIFSSNWKLNTCSIKHMIKWLLITYNE